MFTPLMSLLLSVTLLPQTAPVQTATAEAPARALDSQTAGVRIADGDLAAWVVEGLLGDDRLPDESAEALLLRSGYRADLSIAHEITDRLTAAGVQGMVVACSGGAVELRGQASDAEHRAEAGQLAAGVVGVRTVSNRLSLPGETPDAAASAPAPPAAPPAEPAGPARTEAFDYLVPGGHAGRGIVVEVSEGVVQLTGEVSSPEARRQAAGIASRVTGVRAVRDELTVRPGTLEDDRRLALLVQRRLGNDSLVQTVSNAILVTVDHGVLRLRGSVRDDEQREQAESLARGTEQVFAVSNELAVDSQLILPPKGRIAGFKLYNDF